MSSPGPRGRAPQGARPLGEGGGAKRKRGLLLLLGLLGLLILIGILIALSASGDDDSASSAAPPTTSAATPSAAGASPGTASTTGSFTAGSASWMPGQTAIGQAVGDDAEGSGLEVQEVVEGRGFWVGGSETERSYVELGSQAGETESAPTPKVGDMVTLTGPVRPIPEDPEQTLGLDAAGAEQVTAQGAYVNADEVSIG